MGKVAWFFFTLMVTSKNYLNYLDRFIWTSSIMPCSFLVHNFFIQFFHDLIMTCSELVEEFQFLCITSPQFVPDLFMIVYNLSTICSWLGLAHDLLTTFINYFFIFMISWLFPEFFTTCSRLVYELVFMNKQAGAEMMSCRVWKGV